ncbi:MAG: pyridoxal phosphate-dependent aminotransferase [Bacteroidia bacterium]
MIETMGKLSERVIKLSESQTIKMARISREMKAAGHDVINLSLGEPDFVTAEYICEGAKKAIDDGYTFYTPIAGYLDLREAISEKFKKDNNLDYAPNQIVVSTGAKQSIANVVLSLVDPGDEVVIPAPYWVSYIEIVKLAEGKAVFIPSTVDTNFKISPQQLEKALTERTKLFIFSSPCNPTGTVYSHDELKAFAAVFAKYPDVYIISDEIYEYINFNGQHESIAQFEEIKERVIVVNGFSKGYAMTGWRVGYIGAPKWIADACDKLQGQFTSGTSSISQRAALAALSGGEDILKDMKNKFRVRRDLVLEMLNEIDGMKCNKPEGAFYVFPDVTAFFGRTTPDNTVISSAEDLATYLLINAGVSTVMGEAFGDDKCIRISYAASRETLTEAISRIKKSLAKLS